MVVQRCEGCGCLTDTDGPLPYCSDACREVRHGRLLGKPTRQPPPRPKPPTVSVTEGFQISSDLGGDYDDYRQRMRPGAVERRTRQDLTPVTAAREAQLNDFIRRSKAMTAREGFKRRPDLTSSRGSSADYEYRRQDLTPRYY